MDIRQRTTYPGGRVGTLILAIMLLVVSSGLFAGQRVQAAAPSDKVASSPIEQVPAHAEHRPKADPHFATGKEPIKAPSEVSNVTPSGPQATSNYTFATATNDSLTNMSSGTTQFVGLGPNVDDTASSVTNIGFDFYFQGVRYTQFSVNTNGLMRLGAIAVQGASPYKPLAQANIPLITPYGADQRTHTSGQVHFKVIGAAPNRMLVVEWLNMQSNFNTGGTADLTYQVRLAETTGVIEYVYGKAIMSAAGAADTNSRDPHIGFSSSNIAGTVGSVTAPQSGTPAPTYNGSSATPVANLYTAGTITVLNSTTDGSRRVFTFTPPTPTAPTNLTFTAITASSMTLNWTDSPDELIYAIYRSTDGTNYTFTATAAQNATSFNATGLTPSTTYFWQVYAVSEGALSTALSGSQATTAPGNVTSNVLTGNWSAATTWAGGVVPTSSDNVTIATGSIITIDTAAVAFGVTVNTGGILQYEPTTARTLTVGSSVTINTGGTFQSAATGTQIGHVLSVGTDLTNNGTLDFSTNTNTAGATITFTGAANNTFGGTGTTTDIRAITINKGTSSASVLELNTSNFTVRGVTTDVAGFLTLTNGTFKISGTFTMTNRVFTSATYIIAATTGIWLNNPNFTVVGQAGGTTTVNNGLFRVSQGTYNIGVGAADGMGGGTGAVFIIEGGTVNASGRIDPQNAVSYTQTGGTVNVAVVGNTRSLFGSFEIFNTASSFTMSGGTINVINRNTGATQVDYDVFALTTNVTGGLLVVGAAGAPAATTYHVQGTTPNLTINAGMTMIVTTNANNTFPLFMRGTTVTNNGTITSAVTGSPRFDFAGNGPMTYTGGVFGTAVTPFGGFGVSSNSTSLVTLNSPIITNRVNLFQGGFINSNQITLGNGGTSTTVVQIGSAGITTPGGSFDVSPNHMQGSGGEIVLYNFETAARTTGFEINPTRVLTSMTVDNPNNVTIAGGNLTLSSTGAALTLTNGRLITGANNLILSSGSATVTRTNGYVDGNFRKNYAAAAAKTFEVGTANGYSPIVVTTTVGTTFPALFTAKAVQGPMPSVPAPTLSLQRYWTLTATGVTADLLFNYLQIDIPVTATEANLSIFKFDGTVPMQQAGAINTTTNTFVVTGATSFSDWTLSTFTQWASAIEGAGASLAAPSVYWDNAVPTPNTFITTGGNSNMVKGLDGAGGILWSQNVGGAVQNRGPIINIGGTNVSYFTSQNGWVNALRATDGTSFWAAGVGQIADSVVAGVAYQPNVAVTGGPTSLIFAGTFTDTTLTNRMVALNALTGAEVWSFDNSAGGGLGVIPTGPAVDWGSNTLYFGTNDVSPVNGPGEGLLGAVGVWALDTTNGSVRWANTSIGNVVNSFPTVSRDGQTLYIGTINAGTFTLYALRTSDGTVRASFQAPGGVGDFRGSPWLWPNSANPADTDIYATAGDRVYAFTDAGATGTLPFKSGWATGFATVLGAGTPLFLPSTNHLYVGGNNGTIYKINANNGVITNQFFLGANAAVSDLTYDRVRDTFYLTTDGKLYSVIGNW
jgi:hypothetical protein